MTGAVPVAIKLRTIPFRILTDRSLRPVRHLILVGAIAAVSVSQNLSYYGGQDLPRGGTYLLSLITAVTYLAVAYLHIYLLVPRFLAKGNYLAYLLLSVGAVIALNGMRFVQNVIAEQVWAVAHRLYGLVPLLDSLSDLALNFLCFTGVSVTVLLKYWMEEENRVAELETRRLAVEVESFKNTIDPDMLFDTIHQCGVESVGDPSHSSQMILHLSGLLRYQLYESDRDEAFLDSEIAFIRNYLELVRQRKPTFKYSVSVTGNTMVYVTPFVFMPLIKTALDNMDASEEINIRFDVTREGICFRCGGFSGLGSIGVEGSINGLRAGYGDRIECTYGREGEITISIKNAAD